MTTSFTSMDHLIQQVFDLRNDVKLELIKKANNLDDKVARLVEQSVSVHFASHLGSFHRDCRKLYMVENKELVALWELYMELSDQLLSLLNTKL
jgi:hypothetical protein